MRHPTLLLPTLVTNTSFRVLQGGSILLLLQRLLYLGTLIFVVMISIRLRVGVSLWLRGSFIIFIFEPHIRFINRAGHGLANVAIEHNGNLPRGYSISHYALPNDQPSSV